MGNPQDRSPVAESRRIESPSLASSSGFSSKAPAVVHTFHLKRASFPPQGPKCEPARTQTNQAKTNKRASKQIIEQDNNRTNEPTKQNKQANKQINIFRDGRMPLCSHRKEIPRAPTPTQTQPTNQASKQVSRQASKQPTGQPRKCKCLDQGQALGFRFSGHPRKCLTCRLFRVLSREAV